MSWTSSEQWQCSEQCLQNTIQDFGEKNACIIDTHNFWVFQPNRNFKLQRDYSNERRISNKNIFFRHAKYLLKYIQKEEKCEFEVLMSDPMQIIDVVKMRRCIWNQQSNL